MHGIKKKRILDAVERMEREMCSAGKKIFITSVMICALSGLIGCGKSAEDAEQAGASAVEAENLPTPEDIAERQEGMNPEEPEDGWTDAQVPGQGEESGSTLEDGEKLHYIEEDRDLYGDIWEVGDGQFTVIEIYTDKTEDGGEIMAAPADGTDEQEEAPKITVAYDENTKFIKKKIWDGGAGHEETEGSAADLREGFTAEMNGSYEGDVFHATEIVIVEVILN